MSIFRQGDLPFLAEGLRQGVSITPVCIREYWGSDLIASASAWPWHRGLRKEMTTAQLLATIPVRGVRKRCGT
jgi:hypothetical protein